MKVAGSSSLQGDFSICLYAMLKEAKVGEEMVLGFFLDTPFLNIVRDD